MNDNVIGFPDNDKHYVRLGTVAFENNELELAIWYFEQAYKLNPNGEINYLLVSALLENERNSEALETANEQINFYMNNASYCMTYVYLLISNQLFDKARGIIEKRLKDTFDSRNITEWNTIYQFLDNEESRVQEQIKKLKNNVMKKLYSLNVMTVDEQLKLVDEADILDLNQLQEIAPIIFHGPYIHYFAKVGFLQLLIERQDNNIYNFEWFQRKRSIQPNRLSLFNNHEIVIDLRNKLAQRLEKNPSLKEIVNAELNYHLMLLYPYIKEVVVDRDQWIELYVDKFQNKKPSLEDLDERTLKMKKWQDYLNQLEHRY